MRGLGLLTALLLLQPWPSPAPAASAGQRLSAGVPPSITFFLQSKDRPDLLVLIETRSGDDDGHGGWRSTAESLPDRDTGRFGRFDVAMETLYLDGDTIRMDQTIDDIVRQWTDPDDRRDQPLLLRYNKLWIVTDALSGIVARELVLRQPLVASKVQAIAWSNPGIALGVRRFSIISSSQDLNGETQGILQIPADKYIARQNERWIPTSGTTATDLHCANGKPTSTSDMSRLGCRSLSIVLDPTEGTTPGGTAPMRGWLAKLTRLPGYGVQSKAPVYRTIKLRAQEPLRVNCGSSTYAIPRLTLGDDVKGKIVSAHALLEETTNLGRGSSITVKDFTDREVLVSAELFGLSAVSGNLVGACQPGEARPAAIVTVSEEGVRK